MSIKDIIENPSTVKVDSKVTLFNLEKESDRQIIDSYSNQGKILYIIDDYIEQLKELFALKNASIVYKPQFQKMFNEFIKSLEAKGSLSEQGLWCYYPWLSSVVHILPEEDFFLVRTSRNRNLITLEEQRKYYETVVGISGLSVGSSVAIAVVLQGGSKHIKLADLDVFSLSNTNRIRAGIQNLGLLKTEIVARQIYEINPYAEIELFSEGINEQNIDDFFVGEKKLDIVIDEMDNLAVKYLFREKAREYMLPVVMAADVADNGVIDIERYDLNPEQDFFNGRYGNVTFEELSKLDKFGIGRTIANHIGLENHTERMLSSLLEMGKSIVSWPQLGGTAMINGAAVAYCVRRIANKQPLELNRAIISLDEKLIPNYNSDGQRVYRRRLNDKFKTIFKL